MKVELISHTAEAGKLCGEAAAVCTNSKNPENSLRHAVESGHESVLEHGVFTFRVSGLSRAALAQLTRHRLASFDVQSQRYVRIKGVDLVMPESIRHSDFYTEAGLTNVQAGVVESQMQLVRQTSARSIHAVVILFGVSLGLLLNNYSLMNKRAMMTEEQLGLVREML